MINNCLSTLLVYFSHVLTDNGQIEGRYCELERSWPFWTPFFTQGKKQCHLYYDHVTKCFVSKCVIQVAMYCYAVISYFFPNLNSSITISGTLRC